MNEYIHWRTFSKFAFYQRSRYAVTASGYYKTKMEHIPSIEASPGYEAHITAANWKIPIGMLL